MTYALAHVGDSDTQELRAGRGSPGATTGPDVDRVQVSVPWGSVPAEKETVTRLVVTGAAGLKRGTGHGSGPGRPEWSAARTDCRISGLARQSSNGQA